MTRPIIAVFLLSFLAVAGSRSSAADSDLDIARRLNQAFAAVAEKVSPSVVVINVTEKPDLISVDSELDGESATNSATSEFWRRFHQQFENEHPSRDEASGIIIRTNGFILTNRHVVENARDIQVRLFDGRTFKAALRGVDPQSDLAVIKIEADNLPAAIFAHASKVRVGEFAIAIGAPFEYDYSVTFGHVSATGRSHVVPAFENGAMMDQDFIQTDANLNPGNSGGPLLNIDGEVIGINTMIRGLRTGIGFAVPSDLAREVSDELVARGKFRRPWLGISIRAWRDEPDYHPLADGLKDGVIIKMILPEGPAAKSDLRNGDIITSVDGNPVGTPQQLRNEVRHKKIAQPVSLDIVRAGKPLKIQIAPDEYIEPETLVAVEPRRPFAPIPLPAPETVVAENCGITVRPLEPELVTMFGLGSTNGVLVVAVDRNSPAERANIKPGDVITEIARQSIATPDDFSAALKKADLKKGVPIKLINGDNERLEILKQSQPR